MDLLYQHDPNGTGMGTRMQVGTGHQSFRLTLKSAFSQALHGISHGEHDAPAQRNEDPKGGLVLFLSGCEDHQMAADASSMFNGQPGGAMTMAFIETVTTNAYGSYSYRSLVQTMTRTLRQARLQQTPTLSSSHPFDMDLAFCL